MGTHEDSYHESKDYKKRNLLINSVTIFNYNVCIILTIKINNSGFKNKKEGTVIVSGA